MQQKSSSISYPGQTSTEVTQRVIYKHIMSIAPFIVFLIAMFVFITIFALFYSLNADFLSNYVGQGVISLIGFALLSISVFIFLAVVWIWRNNKMIITNEHIVDVDQIGLFNKNVSTLRLGEIQDINTSVNGPAQIVFKYGTIVIQTAGERANFIFDFVPNPYDIEHYILETRKKYLHKNGKS